MSIKLETERIKSAKSALKTVIDSKLETPIPESATLDQYPIYVEQLTAAGGGDQINEQLSSQVTKLTIAPSEKGTVKLTWEIPNDDLYWGADISWATGATPTFPLNEDNVILAGKNMNSVIIEGLEPDTLYGFVVMAKNRNGARNTSVNAENSVLGYVSEQEVFYEVDYPEALTNSGSVYINAVPSMDLFFAYGSGSNDNYGLCVYNVKNQEWTTLLTTGYSFKLIGSCETTGDVFIGSNTSASFTGVWRYNVNDNTIQKINSSVYYCRGFVTKEGNCYFTGDNDRIDTYKYDVATGTTKTVSTNHGLVGNGMVYETDDYVICVVTDYAYSDAREHLGKLNKSNDSITTLVTNNNSANYWYSYTTSNGDVFIYYGPSDKIKSTSHWLLDIPSGTVTKVLSESSTIYELNNTLFGIANATVYKYNTLIKTFEPISGGFDNTDEEIIISTIQVVAFFGETIFCLAIPHNVTVGEQQPLRLYRYNFATDTMNMVGVFTNPNFSPYNYYYTIKLLPSRNKLFAWVSSSSDFTNSEILVYDKSTNIATSVDTSTNFRLFVDKEDHAFKVPTTNSSSNKATVFNPETNAFDITPNVTIGYSTLTSTTESICNLLEMSDGTIVFSFINYTDSTDLYTYYFDKNGEFKQVNTTKAYNKVYKNYMFKNSGAVLYYDVSTNSFKATEFVGGTELVLGKYLNTTTDILTFYGDKRIETHALEGDYTTVSKGNYKGRDYAYSTSTTDKKILVAF